jgi:phage host-nuclease inhibitor protein Gam
MTKRQPLPPEFEHFEQAAARADEIAAMERRRAAEIAELARRLQAVRDGLDAYKKARKK